MSKDHRDMIDPVQDATYKGIQKTSSHKYELVLDLKELVIVQKFNLETLTWDTLENIDVNLFGKFPDKPSNIFENNNC